MLRIRLWPLRRDDSSSVGVVVWWIEAYHTGPVSSMHVGGELPGAIPIHCGVPQGSLIVQVIRGSRGSNRQYILYLSTQCTEAANKARRLALTIRRSFKIVRNWLPSHYTGL